MSVHHLGDRPHPSERRTVTRVSSAAHLSWVLKQARKDFELGRRAEALDNLCHACFVAATDGRGQLTETDLVHELRAVREAARG